MRTIAEIDRINKRFRRISKFGKWVSKHISKKLGWAIIDWNDERWFNAY